MKIIKELTFYTELFQSIFLCVMQMIDLMYFMVIMMVFVVAYGITSQVILYPNSDLNLSLVIDILSYSWWSIFGEFNLEEVSG